jgi:hypothetical protein
VKRQPDAVAFPSASHVAVPVLAFEASTFAAIPQMFAAMPIGTWIVLSAT